MDEERIPVVIGAAHSIERHDVVTTEDLTERASAAAIAEAPKLSAAIERVSVVNTIFSPAVADGASELSRRLGLTPAVKEATKAGIQLEMTYEELVSKKAELEVALGESEKAREDAKEAQKDAERNEAVAIQAKRVAENAEAEATASKQEVERLLDREKKRVKELEEQIGQMIETLK